MRAFVEIASSHLQNSNFPATFVDIALKSVVVLGLAAGLCLCWRRASAATRHWIWFLAVAGLLCLPFLSFRQPLWQRPLWQVSADLNSANQVALAIEFGAPAGQTSPAVPQAKPATTAPLPSGGNPRIVTHLDRQWLLVASVVWFDGVMLMLWCLAAGRIRLWMIRRRAQAFESADCTELCHRLSQELGFRRPVVLLQSSDNAMPMTWGCWRPIVLLPARATQWSIDRQRVVLLHELAHVKRWDCLTQTITRIVRAFYWFNPLVWLAARRMCIERERACDDLVLNTGSRASDYANHLVEIAQSFRPTSKVTAIAMARPSGLQRRVTAILDANRNRNSVAKAAAALSAFVAIGLGLFLAACAVTRQPTPQTWSINRSEVGNQLKRFVAEKKAQAFAAAKPEGREVLPEYKAMYAAAAKGDWLSVSNLWEDMRSRAPQYEGSGPKDGRLHGTGWQTMLEIWGAFGHFAIGDERPMIRLGKATVDSISPGSIYFGGTDPGRCVITALQKSHVNADPFFTLTQNALADGTYLEYLRRMYGNRIYIPTKEDSEKSFQQYVQDAEQRFKENKLKPGENVKMVEGKPQVTGQVAVMAINGLLAKIIFDKNPNHEFYVEESFPLDWMYPYLEPAGAIMKINRQPLSQLSGDIVRKDHEYWSRSLKPMIGDWLTDETPIQQVTAFAARKYTQQPEPDQYYHSDSAQKWASKLRSSIAGVYAWRADQAANESEKVRMRREADFAFRQAYAVCPYSPEALFRYVNLLVSQKRFPEALLLAETSAKLQPTDQFQNLIKELKKAQQAN